MRQRGHRARARPQTRANGGKRASLQRLVLRFFGNKKAVRAITKGDHKEHALYSLGPSSGVAWALAEGLHRALTLLGGRRPQLGGSKRYLCGCTFVGIGCHGS